MHVTISSHCKKTQLYMGNNKKLCFGTIHLKHVSLAKTYAFISFFICDLVVWLSLSSFLLLLSHRWQNLLLLVVGTQMLVWQKRPEQQHLQNQRQAQHQLV